jgi:hypothetical protein
VFKVTPDGSETILHSFQGHPNDGATAVAGLIADDQANLYSTTEEAGNYEFQGLACGAVFKLAPNGTESVLYNSCSVSDGKSCNSGGVPLGGIAMDNQGNLYGTTETGGGGATSCSWGIWCGTAFKLSSDGKFTVLHAFGNGNDGWQPQPGGSR